MELIPSLSTPRWVQPLSRWVQRISRRVGLGTDKTLGGRDVNSKPRRRNHASDSDTDHAGDTADQLKKTPLVLDASGTSGANSIFKISVPGLQASLLILAPD